MKTEVHRVRLFDYTPSPIVSLSLHPEFGILAVGRSSGVLEFWSVDHNCHCIGSLEVSLPDDLKSVVWCRCCGRDAVAVGTMTGQLDIYDYATLSNVGVAAYGGNIYELAAGAGGSLLVAACGEQRVVRIFSTDRGLELLRSSDLLDGAVVSVCLCSDGRSALAGTSCGQIARIDVESGRLVAMHNVPSSQPECVTVWAVRELDDESFASGDSTGALRIWNSATATVVDEFASAQGDVYALAVRGGTLWASGVDPTVYQYSYSARARAWAQSGQCRCHTHDVVALAADHSGFVIGGSKDATFSVRRARVFPHQRAPAIASALCGGEIVIAGGIGRALSVWRLNGREAKLDLTLKTSEDGHQIAAVAVARGGAKIAYSANETREIVRGDKWAFGGRYAAASALAYSPDDRLYYGTLSGIVGDEDGRTISVGFPVFKIAFSSDGSDVCVGGFGRIVRLTADLREVVQEVPRTRSVFSTFEFQPGTRKLFISTGEETLFVYNLEQRLMETEMVKSFGKKNNASVNGIRFNPGNPNKVIHYSSKRAVIVDYQKLDGEFYTLPYSDILYIDYIAENKIVVYEKPWIFFMNDLPEVFKAKRFLSNNEDQMIRY